MPGHMRVRSGSQSQAYSEGRRNTTANGLKTAMTTASAASHTSATV
jgi:hypothetical protein